MPSGEIHTYRLRAEAGHYLRFVVEQEKPLEVVLTLRGPDGEQLMQADFERGVEFPEWLVWVTTREGEYRLELQPVDDSPEPGRYSLLWAEARLAEAGDREEVAAAAASAEAIRMYWLQTAETRSQVQRSLEAAAELWRVSGYEGRTAALLNYLAELHIRQGEGELARQTAQRALEISQRCGCLRREASARDYLGEAAEVSGDLLGAVSHYRAALGLWNRLGSEEGQALTLNNLAVVYSAQGNRWQALELLKKVLSLWSRMGDTNAAAYARANIGGVYMSLGEWELARHYCQRSLTGRMPEDHLGLGSVLMYLSQIELETDHPKEAREYLRRALDLYRAGGHHEKEAAALTLTGQALALEGRPKRALETLETALGLRRRLGGRRGIASTLRALATVLRSLDQPGTAREHLEEALQSIRLVGDRESEVQILYLLARTELDLGHGATARKQLHEALEVFEGLRSQTPARRLRGTFSASLHHLYELALEVEMGLHEATPGRGHDEAAFAIAERARARALREIMAAADLGPTGSLAPRLSARREQLRRQLESAEQAQAERLARGGGAAAGTPRGDRDASSGQIEAALLELLDVEYQIEAESRSSDASTLPPTLGVGEIQTGLLDADTLLLEYALGEDRSFLWALTAHSFDSIVLPPRRTIETTARDFHRALSAPGRRVRFETEEERQLRLAAAEVKASSAAARLSRMLLEPVAEHLGHRRLLVVADGALLYVPFAALPRPVPREGTDGIHPLLERHEVVTAPSASLVADLRRRARPRPPARTLVVVGDPVYNRRDPRLRRAAREEATPDSPLAGTENEPSGALPGLARESDLSPFDRLPGSRREVERIASLLPPSQVSMVVGFAASRDWLLAGGLRGHRLIHLAAHGVLDDRHPELSALVLSLLDPGGEPRNGFLRLHDLYSLDLEADLVVLSACRTGLGRELSGEGLVGLTRGIFSAGVPAVVASLWASHDEATAELMEQFYRALLLDGLAPGAALRSAQLSLRNGGPWSRPYFWAGFVLQGDWR